MPRSRLCESVARGDAVEPWVSGFRERERHPSLVGVDVDTRQLQAEQFTIVDAVDQALQVRRCDGLSRQHRLRPRQLLGGHDLARRRDQLHCGPLRRNRQGQLDQVIPRRRQRVDDDDGARGAGLGQQVQGAVANGLGEVPGLLESGLHLKGGLVDPATGDRVMARRIDHPSPGQIEVTLGDLPKHQGRQRLGIPGKQSLAHRHGLLEWPPHGEDAGQDVGTGVTAQLTRDDG
ncbi:MAG: hypothetical protein BWY91_03145 [bacterium ADurb.BinA028]|nr:MAG: hypothetical protein BWY91_03145 [bacterium ADurb.BinA028]